MQYTLFSVVTFWNTKPYFLYIPMTVEVSGDLAETHLYYWKIIWSRTIIIIVGILSLNSEDLNGDLVLSGANLEQNMTSLGA